MSFRSVLCFVILVINIVTSLNILAIYPHRGKSQFFVHRVLLRELSRRGHNVTVISHFPENNSTLNYQDINLAGKVKVEVTKNRYDSSNVIQQIYRLAVAGVRNCKDLLENKNVQKFIKQKNNFDVILLELFNSDCALGIAYKIGGPIIGTTSQVLLLQYNENFGIPSNPSYEPFRYLSGGYHPTLLQRIERLFFEAYFKIVFYASEKTHEYILGKYFNDIPPMKELRKKMKLLLAYEGFSMIGSRLLPGNVKDVTGFHITKAQPLQGELKRFYDAAEHGVIYISLGSLTNTSTFDEAKLQAVLETMEELPQRFVIKWNKYIISARRNKVFVDDWFSQVDILAHPKTVAFLSHGGMASTVEAIHFGVPIVAMPLFGDQPSNAAAIEANHLGVQVQYNNLNRDDLLAAFKKVLHPLFRAKVKEISAAWRDRPIPAMEEAVFWVEFVARHPALSFRTRSADVPFYQYLFLDVIGLVLIVFFIVLKIVKVCLGRTKRKFSRVNKQKQA